MDRGDRTLIAAGSAFLLAVVLGALVCWLAGVPAVIWAINPVAWLVGAGLAWALSRRAPSAGTLRGIGAAVLCACALPLITGPDLDGVRRWLSAGPLTVNMALLMLPIGIVAAGLVTSVWKWVALPAVGMILVIQPDASQAAALACATVVLAVLGPGPRGVRFGAGVAAVLAAGLAMSRPDPTAPVPHVEQILFLAWTITPALAVAVAAATASVAAALAPWGSLRPDGHLRAAVAALFAWTLATLIAPALGAFPQPLVGVGASPIVGLWLAVGLLAGASRRAVLEPDAA